MKLKTYLDRLPYGAKKQLAEQVGITPGYISRLLSGSIASPSPSVAVRLERATCGQVTRRDLRPHDWLTLWPELARNDNGGAAALAEQERKA